MSLDRGRSVFAPLRAKTASRRCRRPRLTVTAIAAAAVLIPIAGATAKTATWNGGITGLNQTWNSAGNWTGGLPAAGDTVIIPGTTAQDTFVNYGYTSWPGTFASLTLNQNNPLIGVRSTAVLFIAGTLTFGASAEYIGDSSAAGARGQGRIEQSAGSNTTPLLMLGRLGTNFGGYVLSGAGQLAATDVRVGEAGRGIFTHTSGIHDASNLTLGNLAASSGTYNLSGTGLLQIPGQFTIGNAGAGTFTVTGGARGTQYAESGFTSLGGAPGATGNATVSDPGSRFNATRMFVGSTGTGTLTVQNGGQVTSGLSYIGYISTGVGTVTVTGVGSTWTSSDRVHVGGVGGIANPGGNGTLNIEAGGVVTSGAGMIANTPNSVGSVTVGGAGSAWNVNDELTIGGFGNAALNLDPGGAVNVANVLLHAGLVRLRGGTLRTRVFRPVTGGTPGVLDWTAGRLETGVFEDNLVNAAGTYSPWPSASVAVPSINGNYTQQAGGTMAFDINGPPSSPSGTNDTVQIYGNAALDGTLNLALPSGFAPKPSDAFGLLMTFGTQTGMFANITGYAIAPGQDFAVHYVNNAIVARAGTWNNPQLDGTIDVPGAKLDVSGNATWTGTLDKRGAGQMRFKLSSASGGGPGRRLNVQAGNVLLLSGVDVASSAAGLAIHVTGTGGLTMDATQHLGALDVGDGRLAALLSGASSGGPRRVLSARTVELHDAGTLDLADNLLIVRAGELGTFTTGAYTGVQGDVARAYNFGAWDMPGLTTSELRAGPNGGPLSGTTTIAVSTAQAVLFLANATDTGVFAGETVTGSAILAMYTYAGDLNLDGLVDAADYGVIDNWVQFPGTSGYANGDINYDGVIDAGDYGIIDNTIQLQGAPMPATGAPADLASVSAVPEPSACGGAILAGAALIGRRRRCTA